jgi:MSHA biogenesis protein MshK
MAQRLRLLAAALGMIAATAATAGESLPDPTRPPIDLQGGVVDAGAAAGPRIRMIRISPTRRSAIVDGQEVMVGSRVGDARVVKITEDAVVLRGPAGTETLKLFANVDKRPVTTGAAPRKPVRALRKKTDASSSRKAKE